MISKSTDLPIVALSVRLYQLLLFAYPSRFQQEYGFEMAQVFRDCCLRTIRRSGMNGILDLWLSTLLDLAQSVIAEHMQKETQMKKEMKPEDIRRAGWALILAGISFVFSIFVAIEAGEDGSTLALPLLVFVSLPLLVFGVLGLRNRYGETVGSFGKNILLIGIILGPVTSLLGFFLSAVGELWLLAWAGPAVLFICLALFGMATITAKPLPRWNVLPILAGLAYPAIILFHVVNSLMTRDWSGSGMPYVVIIILITIQGIALLALGYLLKADVPEETPTLA
jgi:hypothetical protein